MKYIRTKDGHLLEVIRQSESNKSYITKPKGWIIHKDRVIKQANTIEELCDEFIGVVGNMHRQLTGTNIRSWNDCTIYGAIWTDKGLIYVAKMNEKGEFELL